LAPSTGSSRVDRGRDRLPTRRRAGDTHRDRASRVGAARRRRTAGARHARERLGDAAAALSGSRRDGRSRGGDRMSGSGTKDDPWQLKTPPGTSEYQMWRDDAADPPVIVCQVGSTQLKYDARAIDDLHAMLKAHGDWMDLGAADEQKDAKPGTVEAWGRDPSNPVGGWYGTRKGYRGRFGMYMPPLLEALGLAELTHDAKNNRMRAI